MLCYSNDSDAFKKGWVRCTRCGLVARDPLPAAEDMNRLYIDKPYRPEAQLDSARADYAESILERYCRPKQSEDDLRLPRLPGKRRVLDIGCGRGLLGRRLLDSRLASESLGVEINPLRVKECLIPVRQTFPEDGTAFDILILSHFLEHIPDPKRALQDALRCVTPSAFVWVEVPTEDMDSQGSISLFITPDHLFAFSERTILRLLRSCGLTAIQVESRVSEGPEGTSGVCSILARNSI